MEIYREVVQLLTPMMGAVALYLFQRMSESISELNKNVAVVIEKIEKQESEIKESREVSTKHGSEISELKLSIAKLKCVP